MKKKNLFIWAVLILLGASALLTAGVWRRYTRAVSESLTEDDPSQLGAAFGGENLKCVDSSTRKITVLFQRGNLGNELIFPNLKTVVLEGLERRGYSEEEKDRLVAGAGSNLYISFDNEMVGTLMAEGMKEALPEGGNIFAIYGSLGDHSVSMVRKGFLTGIQNSGLDVVYSAYCDNWLAELAFEAVEELAMRAAQFALGYEKMEEENRISKEDIPKEIEGFQKELEELDTISDGEEEIPCCLLEPQAVTRENMDAVIIDSGFHSREEVYLNVEREQ